MLKIKYPAARRCLQPQAADAWLREEPGREGDVVQYFPERWRGSPTDAVDHAAHRDSDCLAGGSFFRRPRHTQAVECFSIHSLRQRLSVNNFRSHAPAAKTDSNRYQEHERSDTVDALQRCVPDLLPWIAKELVTETAQEGRPETICSCENQRGRDTRRIKNGQADVPRSHHAMRGRDTNDL